MVIYLIDRGYYLIKEHPVVGYYHHRPAVALKIALKPLYGIDVQVVCGLVQKKDIGL